MFKNILFFIVFIVYAEISYATQIGISYPPISNNSQLEFSIKTLSELSVSLVRFSVHWKDIETKKGVFNFDNLDARLSKLHSSGIKTMLTIEALSPSFYCSAKKNNSSCVFVDNKKLANFIKKLVGRYGSKIHKIQFANEVLDKVFYIGDVQEFINAHNAFYFAVKSIDPDLTVVLSGFSTGVLRRFSACARGGIDNVIYKNKIYVENDLKELCLKKWVIQQNIKVLNILKNTNFDEIDLHLYDDVKNWNGIIVSLRGEVSVPIIVSEFGGPMVGCQDDFKICHMGVSESQSLYSDNYQAQRLHDYIKVLKNSDVEEAYYFKLVELNQPMRMHAKSGLFIWDGITAIKKKAFDVFKSEAKAKALR